MADAAARTTGDGNRPGSIKLVAFTSRLNDAVRYDAPLRTVTDDIRILYIKVELIRE